MDIRIGVVFHLNPFTRTPGIDLVRLKEISSGLAGQGFQVEIVAPVESPGIWQAGLKVVPLAVLDEVGRYDLLKTCYHQSIRLIGNHRGPVISRIVRVVDEELPRRDRNRAELLRCQELIAQRSSAVALNNEYNAERWRARYGPTRPILLTPTGCPAEIPEPGLSPYEPGERVVLFLGSIAAEHMAGMLNSAARGLAGTARVHLLGLNKTGMYGQEIELEPSLIVHPPRPEAEIWDFLHHADLGLALATGAEPFDNDISKIYNYLRAGLPVLSEEPILQNRMILKSGLGAVFPHGQAAAMIARAESLLKDPPARKLRRAAAVGVAKSEAWSTRAETYARFIRNLIDRS